MYLRYSIELVTFKIKLIMHYKIMITWKFIEQTSNRYQIALGQVSTLKRHKIINKHQLMRWIVQ